MTGLMDFPFDAMDKEMSNTEKKLYGKKARKDHEDRYQGETITVMN